MIAVTFDGKIQVFKKHPVYVVKLFCYNQWPRMTNVPDVAESWMEENIHITVWLKTVAHLKLRKIKRNMTFKSNSKWQTQNIHLQKVERHF